MPRVFSPEMFEDEEALSAVYDSDDDDDDPYCVSPSAFQYLPPPVMGGPEGQVHVAVRPDQVGKVLNKPTQLQEMYPPHKSQLEYEAKVEAEGAAIATGLVTLGAARAYGRYDGGNDEGFAWFDHCVFRDGSTRDAEQIAKDLSAAKIIIMPSKGAPDFGYGTLEEVASFWAAKLLGDSFGTGEYVLYGAFWVDLETGLVTDDPNPEPVVKNISLKMDS